MKIFLIGMPGSGKSTIGRPLAEELNLPFVDQDTEIENREGKSVPDIFSQQGEVYFRQVESEVLREWAGSAKSFVMATGGGAPCFHQGMDVVNQSGISIFLDVPVRELLQRVASNKHRPLLHAADLKEKEERLTALHEKRLQIYSQAHIRLSTPVLKDVLEALRLRS